LVTGVVLSTLLTIQVLPDRVSLRIGQTAPEDIVAHKYAQYEDVAVTRRIQTAAEQTVPKQYANDQNAPRQAEEEVHHLFAALRRWGGRIGSPRRAADPGRFAAGGAAAQSDL